MSGGELLLTIILAAITTAGLHFGLGLVLWLAALIGIVLALLGCVVFVLVFDGDGLPW